MALRGQHQRLKTGYQFNRGDVIAEHVAAPNGTILTPLDLKCPAGTIHDSHCQL